MHEAALALAPILQRTDNVAESIWKVPMDELPDVVGGSLHHMTVAMPLRNGR